MHTRTLTLAQHLASAIGARQNCVKSGNDEWFARHTDNIDSLARDFLPSGSGVDTGSKVDLDASTGDKIVLTCGYHHMHESGMYDGWTEHTILVCPAFQGFDIRVSGRNRNEIKDYLVEIFDLALSERIVQTVDGYYREWTESFAA